MPPPTSPKPRSSAKKKSAAPTPRKKSAPQPKPSRARRSAPAKKTPRKKSAQKNPTPPVLNPRALSRLDLVSLITATRVTSLSSATIGNWVAAGCPRNADGSFDIVIIAAWLAAERRNRATSTAKESKALERMRGYRADLLELQLKIRTGELVESHVVEDQCREIGLTLRNAFASIERRHGRAVGDEIRSALDTAFRKMQIAETSAPA